MLEEVSKRDHKAWVTLSQSLSRDLRREIETAPTGAVLKQLLEEQVLLITSLPIEAGERVHKLTMEMITEGGRAKELAAEIMKSGQVSLSRAKCIARTEVARTASNLTQARATHVGSEAYIWRTSGDSDVREDHKKLNGKIIFWNEPPISDSRSGVRAHAGCIYQCRCYPEPIIIDED
jgi:SPP1 gp7 family putative phage head morphogenesis protein